MDNAFDRRLLLGGAAGQGLDTSAHLLGMLLNRLGYEVMITKDYMSRIRGGHNFYRIRVANQPVKAPTEEMDMIFCFNQETLETHTERLPQGGIACGDVKSGNSESSGASGVKLIKLPWNEWAAKEVGNPKTVSTVALSSICYFMDIDQALLLDMVPGFFPEKLQEINRKAVELGLEKTKSAVTEAYPDFDLDITRLPEPERNPGWEKTHDEDVDDPASEQEKRLLISGNEAVGMSAVASGCKFYSTYPMTPSTGIMNYLANKQKEANLVVEQSEDEIAGINMALGAASSGVRAMTGSSGGGFSLMVEALGLSGVGEIPLVVAEAQRPGPATGLPTRTEQGDLMFVLSAAQGEFPRAVMSLTSIRDAFYRTNKAFELAQKYQLPVIILSDQYLADQFATVSPFDFQRLACHDYTLTQAELEEQRKAHGRYARYAFTDSGVSPLSYPGQYEGESVLTDSHEHDVFGNITEDQTLRVDMVNKRMRKLEGLQREMTPPEYYGSPNPDYVLVGWGSTKNLLEEAVDVLDEEEYQVGLVQFSDLYPLPEHPLEDMMNKGIQLIAAENNATAQLAQYLKQQAGIHINEFILRYDGRPLTWEEVVSEVKTISSSTR